MRAEALGLDSVWVGDSILARPRFEPLTTLAAIADAVIATDAQGRVTYGTYTAALPAYVQYTSHRASRESCACQTGRGRCSTNSAGVLPSARWRHTA